MAGEWPEAVRRAGVIQDFGRRQVLLREGLHEPSVLLIERGKVLRQRRLSHGGVTVFDVHSHGEVLGVAQVLDGGRQLDTIVALTAVRTIAIDQDTFSDLLQSMPAARLRFDEQLGRWYRHDSTRAASIATEPVDVRLKRLLGDLAKRYGVYGDRRGLMLNLGLTRREIAALLGAAHETAIRQINKLRNAGVLTTEGRAFFIPDPEKLVP